MSYLVLNNILNMCSLYPPNLLLFFKSFLFLCSTFSYKFLIQLINLYKIKDMLRFWLGCHWILYHFEEDWFFFYSILHTILILPIHKYVISPHSFESSLIHLNKICRFFSLRLCIFLWGLFLDILCYFIGCYIQILFESAFFKKYFLIFWLYIEIKFILTCWTVILLDLAELIF